MIGSQLPKLQESAQLLRTGKIIQGKIVKLYPNNKATIQLGTNQLIAQLEASLAVGERYHFQVQTSENMIHLKVLGSPLTYKNQVNLLELLHHLGIKATKVNQSFLQSLLEKKIPFEKSQLLRAISLLDGTSDKKQAQTILRDMIVNRIPITDSIFQALQERTSGNFSERLSLLNQNVQQNDSVQNNIKQGLFEPFRHLISQESLVPKLKIIAENQELFQVMKSLQIIDKESQFTNWGERVRNISSGNLIELNQLVNVDKLQNLFAIDSIQQNAVSILNKFGDAIRASIFGNTPLSPDVFSNLLKENEQIVHHLLQNRNHNIANNPQYLQYLLQELETLASREKLPGFNQFIHQFIKDAFAEQTRSVVQNVGLQYEKAILNEENNPVTTLKAMILSLVQNSDGTIQEQANKLLQFIHGMQLQSVQETDKFLQANLLIPAIKFGLEKDVELTFEGKKTDNGEIDPDFCRVVFYLELLTIKNTVVDMHVQKRAISLTILNDHSVEDIMKPLQTLLKDGLERINYHLSSVTLRPLTNIDLNQPKNTFKYKNEQSSYQGVDFRI